MNPSTPLRVLMLCVANSARSQMAEALMRQLFGAAVAVQSAGSRPTRVDPRAIVAMAEIGVDLSTHRSSSVDEVELERVDLVITLCAEEECPVLPGQVERLSWAMPDPAGPPGERSAEEQLLGFRIARDTLHARLLDLGRTRGLPVVGRPGPLHLTVPVVAVIGWKNAGKTTLLSRLVAELSGRGLRVGTAKVTHHDVDPDPPGKDSWRHRQAGAAQTVLVGPRRWSLTCEQPDGFGAALSRLTDVDLVLVEGQRHASLPKIEVAASPLSRPLLVHGDPDIFLVASDDPVADGVSVLPRDAVGHIADALLRHVGLSAASSAT